MAKHWMQSARERMEKKGTVGSFTALAKRHGESPLAYAHQVLAHPGRHPLKVRRKAQFAVNANK